MQVACSCLLHPMELCGRLLFLMCVSAQRMANQELSPSLGVQGWWSFTELGVIHSHG